MSDGSFTMGIILALVGTCYFLLATILPARPEPRHPAVRRCPWCQDELGRLCSYDDGRVLWVCMRKGCGFETITGGRL